MIRIKNIICMKNLGRPINFVSIMCYLCKQNAIPIISIT